MKTAVLNRRKTRNRSHLKVICCANMEAIEGFAGRTVSQTRCSLTEVLNIPADARSEVDGRVVENDYVLNAEDEVLEFVRPAGVGEKG